MEFEGMKPYEENMSPEDRDAACELLFGISQDLMQFRELLTAWSGAIFSIDVLPEEFPDKILVTFYSRENNN